MNRPMTVHLEVAGHVGADLVEWLEPLTAELRGAGTVFSGSVPDQAAAHALCNRVRDLGIAITTLIITQKESSS